MIQRTQSPSVLPVTLGLDLGDRSTSWCLMGDGDVPAEGAVLARGSSRTEAPDLCATCEEAIQRGARRVVLEVGTHSPWISRALAELGIEVVVVDPFATKLLWQSHRKSDRRDAEFLARMGRADIQLLHPVQHRGARAQADLSLLRTRAQLVSVRADLVNHVRGSCKAVGTRLPTCSTDSFPKKVASSIPEELKTAQDLALSVIADLTSKIRELDRQVERTSEESYPETKLLRQVPGVGPITALTFVLTIERSDRLRGTRNAGAYLGLVPRRSQSGRRDPELHISKCGDQDLRRLLVTCAHYILGGLGPDTDLKRFGARIAGSGGKAAKRRAVVATARKLAVLLLSLWRSGEEYEPLRNTKRSQTEAA